MKSNSNVVQRSRNLRAFFQNIAGPWRRGGKYGKSPPRDVPPRHRRRRKIRVGAKFGPVGGTCSWYRLVRARKARRGFEVTYSIEFSSADQRSPGIFPNASTTGSMVADIDPSENDRPVRSLRRARPPARPRQGMH